MFTRSEFDALSKYLENDGKILFMMNEGGEHK